MSFSARLIQDQIQVEAGGNVPATLEITNGGAEQDTFELIVDGLDPEWFAVPVSTVTLEPGESATEKIFVKPPRASESAAGTYPFALRVRSLTSGDARALPISVEIAPFHHISVDVSPKKGVISPRAKSTAFTVTVMNLGNSEHALQMFATDTDDLCTFEFSPSSLTLGPGQEKQITLTASTHSTPLLANSRLFGFTVSARSSAQPTVVGSAQGQIEQRALAAPGAVLGIFLVLAVLSAWILSFPKAPSVEDLVLSADTGQVGTPIQIDYRAANAKSVEISINGTPYRKLLDLSGSVTFTPLEARTYEISAIAAAGSRMGPMVKRTFTATEPPPTPEPKIFTFEVNSGTANVGESVIFTYSVNDAVTKLFLEPLAQPLDAARQSGTIQAEIQRVGRNEFKLVAYNAKGDRVEMKKTVIGVKLSKAKILAFTAEPTTMLEPGGQVTISWQATGAARVELYDGATTQAITSTGGTMTLDITKSVRLVLTAFDEEGLTVKKEIKISVTKPEPPPDASGDTSGEAQPTTQPSPTGSTSGGQPTTTGGRP